jgi:hypothetical protein
MKKFFSVILMTSVISFSRIEACDICGCGVGNYYIGILPQFNHQFFGVRYHVSGYSTRLASDPSQFSKDFYQTVELWGGWNLGKKIQLLTFVPYNFNHQNSDDGVTNKSGLGDIIFLANYKVLDMSSATGSDRMISQQLWLGGGVKLPTGKFDVDPSEPDMAAMANGQLGSGSTDFLLNAMYNIRINQFGINSTATYKINSPNKDQFKFGDKSVVSSFAYYAIPVSKTVISPNVGLVYEHSKQSEMQNNKIDLTGGSVLSSSLGTEFSFNRISVGFNVQVPITQNFAENQTKEKSRAMVHISIAI